jgi:predicted small integral membrane protein
VRFGGLMKILLAFRLTTEVHKVFCFSSAVQSFIVEIIIGVLGSSFFIFQGRSMYLSLLNVRSLRFSTFAILMIQTSIILATSSSYIFRSFLLGSIVVMLFELWLWEILMPSNRLRVYFMRMNLARMTLILKFMNNCHHLVQLSLDISI